MAELSIEEQRALLAQVQQQAAAMRQPADDEEGEGDAATEFVAGVNTGLIAKTLGAPVDLINALLSDPVGALATALPAGAMAPEVRAALPRPNLGAEEPVGGSAMIQRGLSEIGAAPPPGEEPDSAAFRIGDLAGQGIGLGLGGAVAGMGRAVAGSTGRAVGTAIPSTVGGRIVTEMGRTMVDRPIRALGAEFAASSGAGAGREIAAQQFPDSPAAQAIGEIIGGFTPAGAMASVRGAGRAVDWLVNKLPIVGGMRQIIRPSGQARAEARFSAAIVDEEAARAGLAEEVLPEAGLTPAQRSGDPGLLALERAILDSTTDGIAARDAQLGAARDAIVESIRRLGGGVPASTTREAFSASRAYFADLMDTRIRIAAQAASERIEALGVTATRDQINEIAGEELRAALAAARQHESDLFAAVPMEVQVPTEGTRAAFDTIMAQTPAAQRNDIPDIARRFLGHEEAVDPTFEEAFAAFDLLPEGRRFGDTETIAEMQGLRSELLRIARNSRAGQDPNFNRARIADILADAVLNDMGAARDAVQGEAGEALRAALDFSADLSRRFKQGPVGRLLGFARSGESAINPALTLDRSIGRGGTAGLVEQRALMAAMERTGNQPAMQGAIGDYLRLRFTEMAVRDGAINDAGVRQFYGRFGESLRDLPELRAQFDEAVRIGNASVLQRRQADEALRGFDQSAAAVFIERPPEQAFNQISNHADPAGQMRELMRLAGQDPTGRATRGLKTAFGEWLLGRDGQLPSAETLMRLSGAMEPVNDAQRRIVAMGNALLSEDEIQRLRVIANTAQRVERAMAARPSPEGIISDPPHQVRTLLAGILGARVGRALGTGTIQAPGRTASFFERTVNQLIGDKAPRLLAEGMRDGTLFDRVLNADITTIPQQDRVRQRLNAWIAAVLAEEGRELDPSEQP